jgi:hypothetical protein
MPIAIYPSIKDKPSLADNFTNLVNISNNGELVWLIDGNLINEAIDLGFSFDQYEKIIKELLSSMPIFSRFYDDLPNLNLYLRDLAICIIKLVKALKDSKINCVIMRTASSHHIDSLLLETACQIASIKIIFLNLVVFDNRLLPIIQNEGIRSRTPLGVLVSDHEYNFDNFIKNSGSVNQLNLYQLKNNDSVFPIILRLIRANIRIIFKIFIQFKSPPANHIPKWNFKREVNSLLAYKRTREYLEKKFATRSEIIGLQNSNAIVILAHFEPEATNFPEGGRYHNVLDLVVKIRSSNFVNTIILKEHPMMKYFGQNNYSSRSSISRSKSLVDNLVKLGVIFVDENYKISDKQICLTLSGTVALERSLSGQTTIVAGHPWFRNLPGKVDLDDYLNGSFILKNENLIQSETREYLTSTLNFKTLDNIFNIGTGAPEVDSNNSTDSKSIDQWKTFFNKLELI